MSHNRIVPNTLFDSQPYGFSQVVKTRSGTMVHCAGQTAWDKSGNLIGANDFRAQLEQSLRNVEAALAAAGAKLSDIARLTLYIVNYTPDYLPAVSETMTTFFGPDQYPASTILGVAHLALPDFMIEVEATAVIAD